MAEGASYPAVIVDANGHETAGEFIQFTDQDNQPAVPGPGTGPNATLFLDNSIGATGSFAALIVGGASLAGTIGGSISDTRSVGAMADLISLGDFLADLAGTVESTSDDFDLILLVRVTDALGANQASCSVGTSVPSPVTSLAINTSPAGGTWSVDVGTDLTFDGDVLSSTAGGLFFLFFNVRGFWD